MISRWWSMEKTQRKIFLDTANSQSKLASILKIFERILQISSQEQCIVSQDLEQQLARHFQELYCFRCRKTPYFCTADFPVWKLNLTLTFRNISYFVFFQYRPESFGNVSRECNSKIRRFLNFICEQTNFKRIFDSKLTQSVISSLSY